MARGAQVLLMAALVAGAAAGCAGDRGPAPIKSDGPPIGFGDGTPLGDLSVDSQSWLGDNGLPLDGAPAADGAPPTDGPGPQPDATRDSTRDLGPCPGGCDDNDPCTDDACVNNACQHTPKQCDDGNDCTSDSCVAGQCKHAAAGQPIYRFYNSSTGAHAYLPTQSPPGGFSLEGPVYRLFSGAGGNRVPVYQQVRAANGDYMLSLSAQEGIACCGYTSSGSIGYGFSQAGKGRVPIYRLYWSTRGLHLSSQSNSEGTQIGYALEGTTFWACP